MKKNYRLKNFKKGDTVVMHSCMEAEAHSGRVWTCRTDAWVSTELYRPAREELVHLEGFSGSFMCKYLQLVKIDSI